MGVFAALGGVLVIAVWSGLLVHIDLKHLRLPDALTLPAAAGAIAGALLVDPGLLVTGLLWPALYLVVGVLLGGVGGGDIKLAVSLGIVVAAAAGVTGVLGAVGIAALITVFSAVVHSKSSGAHGPAMLGAAAVTIVAGAVLTGGGCA